jgi:N-methylhydantoinase A/oxoprolinase/acetone carboxylase beta subunit
VSRGAAGRAHGHAIALDVGGTFTDVTLLDASTGRVWITKTPTTPRRLLRAPGGAASLSRWAIDPAAIVFDQYSMVV